MASNVYILSFQSELPRSTSGKRTHLPMQRPKRHSSVPGSGRSPGGGNGNPLQYSCLENLMVRGAQWGTVHSVTESDMTEATWHISQHRCLYQKIKIKNNFLFYQKIKKFLNEGKNIHLKNQKKKTKLSTKQEGRKLAMLEQKSTK